MRFTSLIVELIRARPKLVFWVVVLSQALLWFWLPVIVYSSPPRRRHDACWPMAANIRSAAISGRPWSGSGDIAFRIAGNHVFGVYLLAQMCSIGASLARCSGLAA